MSPRRLGPVLAAALGLAGCRGQTDDEAPARQAPPNPTPPAAPATPPPPTTATDGQDRLLAWLDPDAIAVAYLSLPQRLRADAVAVVYGLPPEAEDLLRAVTDLDQALDAVRPTDAPPTATWLSPEGLVTLGRMAGRPTVLRPLLVPHDQAIARLQALDLRRQDSDDDAFEVWVPQRVFPYEVVLLEGDVAAFIPASEPGTGLLPLAAARDMPPSAAETQLTALLHTPTPPSLALFAVGPMLHLDLSQDVLQVEFVVVRTERGTLDGTMVLRVDQDPAVAVETLEARRAPEQSDRIQQLVERTAYSVESGAVLGRLELPPADAALLLVPGSPSL